MSNGNGRIKRLIAGGVLGLSALAFAPSPAGAAIDTTAFCANVPSGQSGFTDIAQAGVHQRNVECLKASGITSGTTATTYSPQANTTRGQMATFIANMVDKANELDAPGGTSIPDLPTAAQSADQFTDDETSVHENNINRLAQADIIQGQTATTFNPSGTVSRAQMATFIAEALDFIRGAALPEGTDAFTDDETSVHEANINRLANADIVDGVGGNLYNPGGNVSRAQMASFIVQSLADLHADGFITALPAGSNQTLQVSGATETRQANLTDTRTCTVTVPANSTVDLLLLPSSNITNTGGNITFADALPGPGDSRADETATTARIVNVNGAPTSTQEANNVVAGPSGVVSVTIGSGTTDASDVTLVAYIDTAGLTGNELDLAVASPANTSSKAPREAFGIGCRTLFANEAASGAIAHDVVSVSKDADLFNADPAGAPTTPVVTFFYDSNDNLQLFNGATCVQVALSVFEGALSPGDTVTGTYNADAAFPSTICLTDAAPANPNTVTFTPAGTSVRIDVTDGSPTPTADAYNFYRVIRPASGTCPDFQTAAGRAAYTLIGTRTDSTPGAAGGTATFTDTGLTANTFYCYAVTTVDDGDESVGTDEGAGVNTGGGVDAGAPRITDARVQDDGPVVGLVDAGDVHRFIFNEPMAATTDNTSEGYRVQDADAVPSVVDIRCTLGDTDDADPVTTNCFLNTGNVTINGVVYPAGRVLTVELGTGAGGITVVQAGTVSGVSYPATITNVTSGWDDLAGNQLDLAGSPDKTLDVASFTTGP